MLLVALPVLPQSSFTGYASTMVDALPNKDATELRGRVFVDGKGDLGDRLRVEASGFVEGLVADRGGRLTDAFAEPHELNATVRAAHLDLTAGFTRVVWGRLDELQPTDVVNPLDLSRFFFEGRSEARLAVPLVRARVFASDRLSVEGVYVPFFRRGRFDRADEPTSPFNLEPKIASCAAIGCPPVAFTRLSPRRTLGNAQGGGRLNVTTGRVDWSVTGYRGFRPFGIYSAGQSPIGTLQPSLIYPRFTMIGGDIETVAGKWVVRGEVAAFVRDAFQVANALASVPGSSLDAGVGADRRAGSYRISTYVLVHQESRDRFVPIGIPGAVVTVGRGLGPDAVGSVGQGFSLAGSVGQGFSPDVSGSTSSTDASIVVAADRSFAREKYESRLFAVYNAQKHTSFVRGIAVAHLRDNVALEGSAGWFRGAGTDTIGRFADTDFVYAKVKVYF